MWKMGMILLLGKPTRELIYLVQSGVDFFVRFFSVGIDWRFDCWVNSVTSLIFLLHSVDYEHDQQQGTEQRHNSPAYHS